MDDSTTLFEFPLNEKIRAFLRLESMLEELNYFINAKSFWEVQSSIHALNRLLHFLERKDYKLEIIQELEKQLAALDKLKNNPGVNIEQLEGTMASAESFLSTFRGIKRSFDDTIKKDELLSSIRLRIATANLTSSVDLPCLHAWLHTNESVQQERLILWASHFEDLKLVVSFILSTIRSTSLFNEQSATSGIYQQSLEPKHNHALVRLALNCDRHLFPEISGGRHRINVRFLEMSSNTERPKQINENLSFKISFCA